MNAAQPVEAPHKLIARLEALGTLNPNCPGCHEAYAALQAGQPMPFMPRHSPSERCESGKHPHCTCDVCF